MTPRRLSQAQSKTRRRRSRNNDHHSLAVTVIAKGGAREPVEGAKVTVFAGDYEESNRTVGDGTVLFTFKSEATKAIVRVVAEHFEPDQQQLPLKSPEQQAHIVVLTASE
jgi:hypothetical protein